MPDSYDRSYEERLLNLCAQESLDARSWAALGPTFFMAGLAVMLASHPRFNRRRYLALAERLYRGSTTQPVFAQWLELSPLRPSRFLPMLSQHMAHAA